MIENKHLVTQQSVFTDQAAWIAACCYSVPTCLWCMKKSIAKLKQTK